MRRKNAWTTYNKKQLDELIEEKLIIRKEGYIYLTESGQKIADMIYERHEFLSSWLISLGVDPETATSDACRIEHVISPESFTAIKEHLSPGK